VWRLILLWLSGADLRMTLLAVPPEQKFIARGLVLILAVWMDVRFTRDRR